MFLVRKLISFLTPTPPNPPTYIFVDCDTCPETFEQAVELTREGETREGDTIFAHGYSIGKFDLPCDVFKGRAVGEVKESTDNAYTVTRSNPGHKALYRRIDSSKTGMDAGDQIDHMITMVSKVYPGVSCFVITNDDKVMDQVSDTTKVIQNTSVCICRSVNGIKSMIEITQREV